MKLKFVRSIHASGTLRSTQTFDALASMPADWQQFSGQTLGQAAQDIYCGRHSGIPDCCIVFFVNEWPKFTAIERVLWNRSEHVRHPGVHYVRCLRCRELDGPPIIVRRCACDRRGGRYQLFTRTP